MDNKDADDLGTLEEAFDEALGESEDDDVSRLRSLLMGVGDGQEVEVQLYRKAPTYAQGFLGTISADPNDPGGLIEQIARDYGGSKILIKPLRLNASGGKRWARGASYLLRISRPPLVDGRPWGSSAPPVIDVQATQLQPAGAAVPMRTGDRSIDALGQLIDRVVTPLATRLERLEAKLEQPKVAKPSDMFSSLDGAIKMMEKLDALRGRIANPAPEVEDDDEDDEEEEGSGLEGLLERYLDKRMDDGDDDKPSSAPDGWTVHAGGASETSPAPEKTAPDAPTASRIGAMLKQMKPAEVAKVLGDLEEYVTPEVKAHLLREAASLRHAAKGGS